MKWSWDAFDRVVYTGGLLAGAGFLTALCVVLIKAGGGDPSAWAPWVQAVVATLAISGALYASRLQVRGQFDSLEKQQRNDRIFQRRQQKTDRDFQRQQQHDDRVYQRQQRKEDRLLQKRLRREDRLLRQEAHAEGVRRVVQALGDELEVSWSQLENLYGAALLNETVHGGSRPSLAMDNKYPDEPFPIYKGIAGRIVDIPEAQLRREIVEVYAKLEGLVLIIKTNSELARPYLDGIARHANWRKVSSLVGPDQATKDALTSLENYFPTFATYYADTRKVVPAVIGKVQQWIRDQDQSKSA